MNGGDKITAAPKNEANQTFYLQMTSFCLTNDIPQINATASDWGTWRRIKLIEFKSRFVQSADGCRPGFQDFVADNNIDSKLEKWAPAFASLLIDTCIKIRTFGPVPEPQAFVKLHKKLQGRNDIYGRFCEEFVDETEIEQISDNFVALGELWRRFREWLQERNNNNKKYASADAFEDNMIPCLGQLETLDSHKGWYCKLL